MLSHDKPVQLQPKKQCKQQERSPSTYSCGCRYVCALSTCKNTTQPGHLYRRLSWILKSQAAAVRTQSSSFLYEDSAFLPVSCLSLRRLLTPSPVCMVTGDQGHKPRAHVYTVERQLQVVDQEEEELLRRYAAVCTQKQMHGRT